VCGFGLRDLGFACLEHGFLWWAHWSRRFRNARGLVISEGLQILRTRISAAGLALRDNRNGDVGRWGRVRGWSLLLATGHRFLRIETSTSRDHEIIALGVVGGN
jgi:hypothetical protein